MINFIKGIAFLYYYGIIKYDNKTIKKEANIKWIIIIIKKEQKIL